MTAVATVGHNSAVAELADKISDIRDRMKVATRTGSARARWEILLISIAETTHSGPVAPETIPPPIPIQRSIQPASEPNGGRDDAI